jgi:hypothetical protein
VPQAKSVQEAKRVPVEKLANVVLMVIEEIQV